MNTINRTILFDLIRVFALSLTAITGILVLVVVVFEAQKQGLGPWQILIIVPLVVPYTLPYTIPTTTLFATCIVYGRLAHDNEILAIKSAGINVLHVIRPALLIGLVMSATTAGLQYHVIPTCYHSMKTIFLKDAENLLYSVLKRQRSFSHPRLDYEIHVKDVRGRKLIDAVFMHRDANGKGFDIIARAKEAELRVHADHRKIEIHMKNCRINGAEPEIEVRDDIRTVDLPPDILPNRKTKRSDLTWPEIGDRIVHLESEILKLDLEIAKTQSLIGRPKIADDLLLHLGHLRIHQKQKKQQINSLNGEKQRRLAIAMGCFCFVLVGCPVGIWFSRSDYLSAFVTCFLPIVLIYYPLIICGDNLARTGQLNPYIALWPANLLLVMVGLLMYRRLLKN